MIENKYIVYVLIIVAVIVIILIKKKYFNQSDFFATDNYALMSDAYDEPYIINNIINEKEANYIIDKASLEFNDSTILGQNIDTKIRKSKTAWLYKTDPIIMRIMVRIANIVNLPLENAEALQIVKYEPNGYYNEHHDSCCDEHQLCTEFIKRGGQRVKTVLIYLNDEFIEGATNFPVLNKKFKPPKYSAVIFNPLAKNSNKCHPKAIHAGLPVKTGIKYVANLWFREQKFI
jgi:prolyl 4-hydroxylase